MSDDDSVKVTAARLRHLIDNGNLSASDRAIAEQCQRRLEQPLRLTVFGTDPRHAIGLINLMVGQPVVAPSINRARIHFFYGEEPHARLQFRDGSRKRLEGSEFRRLFDDNPSWVRIYINLPVLKKLSLLVATETQTRALCSDVEKTLPASDIALWAGADLNEALAQVWERVPQRLRDHSYLVLSPEMDFASWRPVAQEFVEVLRVDPRRAQDAKAAEGGVNKEAFKASGGAQFVRTIKKEIELLIQSALDASEVLFMRHADVADATKNADLPTDQEEDWPDDDRRPKLTPAETEALITRIASQQQGDPAYAVTLGKLASRSRLLGKSTSGPQITQRTVSMAIKNMPRNASKSPKRVRSRRMSGPATPWSLGL
ncbi:MAG: hypothetical protein AAFY06_01220 [Pseudomonadota bacterium]